MANVLTIQTLLDGPENVVLNVSGVLDTSDLSATTLADPATLNDMGPYAGLKATGLRVKKIQYSIEDQLAVILSWDATTPVVMSEFVGRGEACYTSYGGLQNNAGTGKTGKILISTQGWATSATLSFNLIVQLGKQQ